MNKIPNNGIENNGKSSYLRVDLILSMNVFISSSVRIFLHFTHIIKLYSYSSHFGLNSSFSNVVNVVVLLDGVFVVVFVDIVVVLAVVVVGRLFWILINFFIESSSEFMESSSELVFQ